MPVKLSQNVEITLTVAVSEAGRLGHEYAGLAHLLYALTLDAPVARLLRQVGADLDALKADLVEYLEGELESVHEDEEPRLSLALQRVLAGAAMQVESSGRDEVRGSDLIVAIFSEPDSFAAAALEEQGVRRFDVVSYLAHGVSRSEALGAPRELPAAEEDEDDESAASSEPLEAYAQDLTALARKGGIDPLVGRQRELGRIFHILQRRRKNNPILVGDPGVGKTALVEGLAWKVARNEVPEAFAEVEVYRLDLGALLAGTRYRGDFENRFKALLRALGERRRPILFIDEIHTVVGAGSAGRGTMDASNLLKPALQKGTLRAVGATTWEEYRQIFERDRALSRRFQKVEVAEPSIDETVKILTGLDEQYAGHHGVSYTRAARRSAAELASRFLRDRKLPDSALDLLDEAGAAVALKGGKRVGSREVERVLATMAQLPPRRVRGNDRERLAQLGERLKERIFGQDEPIDRLVSAIKVARAGLRDPLKPIGAFLMTGPTGVGKTELARQLAEVMGVRLLRFDMSEYGERHTVSRLVGAPPGYVGFDQGGLLTEAVAQSPHAVLLLDEIEKAHPEVFNLLLQVMDHGTLTDANGKEVDFRQVILLMTSNVGARELARRQPGFEGDGRDGAAGGATSDSDRAVEQLFSPEFRNRLDARLQFQPLSSETMLKIVDKLVGDLAELLTAKKVTVELTPPARQLLAERGYEPTFGARPLARVLEEEIKRPLTDEILFGELAGGGTVRVGVRDGKIDLAYS